MAQKCSAPNTWGEKTLINSNKKNLEWESGTNDACTAWIKTNKQTKSKVSKTADYVFMGEAVLKSKSFRAVLLLMSTVKRSALAILDM